MSEGGQAPPIIGHVEAEWRDERVQLTLSDGETLVYTLEQCCEMYTTFYQQHRFLAGVSFLMVPTPDGEHYFQFSGEGSVLLYAFLRELRHARNIPDPPDIMAR